MQSHPRGLQLRAFIAKVTVATLAAGIHADSLLARVHDDVADGSATSSIDEHIFFDASWHDYLGFGSAILGLLLAAGGGIGGGGLLVPIYILLLEFPVKHAISLASTTVLGGAIANNILDFKKRHPDHPERPAIDLDLILQLEPTTIAGALIGANLNKELPELTLLVLMLILLTVTAQKTLAKAIKMYRKEEQEIERKQKQMSDNITETSPLLSTEEVHFDIDKSDMDLDLGANGKDFGRGDRDIVVKQSLIDALKLCLLFVAVTLIDLLQGSPDGGGGGPIGLESCGPTCYWVSEVIIFLLIVSFSFYVRSSILKRQNERGPNHIRDTLG
ncbi:hypothetical protein ACHAWF_009388 [Thalassiosira exigua]